MGTAGRISDLQQRAQDGRRRSRAAASGCPGFRGARRPGRDCSSPTVSMIGQRPGVAVTGGWTAAMPAGRRCSPTTEKVFGAFCITALHGDEQRLTGRGRVRPSSPPGDCLRVVDDKRTISSAATIAGCSGGPSGSASRPSCARVSPTDSGRPTSARPTLRSNALPLAGAWRPSSVARRRI